MDGQTDILIANAALNYVVRPKITAVLETFPKLNS